MIFEYSSYSQYLKKVLEDRQASNPSYSMRALAQNLGVSASTLSDVMNGRKNFSERTARQVGEKLKLTDRKIRYFQTLVHFETTKDEELKLLLAGQLRVLNPKLREHFEVSVDQFNLIADWYNAAILEMTYIKDQPMDPESVAQRLDISITQAKEALNLLQKLDLLDPVGNARFQKKKSQFLFQSGIPNQALRKFHHEMLAKAQTSLQTQSPKEKAIGSETVAINIEDLPEARDIIEACFQQILDLSKRSQNKTDVYHLGIQFFKLTKEARR